MVLPLIWHKCSNTVTPVEDNSTWSAKMMCRTLSIIADHLWYKVNTNQYTKPDLKLP